MATGTALCAALLAVGCADGDGDEPGGPGGGSTLAAGETASATIDDDPVDTGDAGSGTAAPSALDAFADVDGAPLYVDMGNSARLSGPVIGSAEAANATLRAEIPVAVASADDGLEVLGGWKLASGRAGAVEEGMEAAVVLLVRNAAAEMACEVRVADYALLDANGNAVSSSGGIASVAGAMADLGGGTAGAGDCLSGGDTSFVVLDAPGIAFDDVADVTIDTLSRLDGGEPGALDAGVVPIGYEILDDPLLTGEGLDGIDPASLPTTLLLAAEPNPLVAVRAFNNGPDTLRLMRWQGLLLDAAGLPVAALSGGSAGCGEDRAHGCDVGPGEEALLPMPFGVPFRFPGQASTLRAVLGWTVDPG